MADVTHSGENVANRTVPISEAPKDGRTVELRYDGLNVKAAWCDETGQWLLREPLVIESLTDSQIAGYVPGMRTKHRRSQGKPNARPISFTTAMVNAVLVGRKRQTRHVPSPVWLQAKAQHDAGKKCYLWVRETWAIGQHDANAPPDDRKDASAVVHCASFSGTPALKWRPSVHMPRHASRITLKVTRATLGPLHKITARDVRQEGLHGAEDVDTIWQHGLRPIEAYAQYWDQMHSRAGCTWDDNPDVVTFTFEPIEANVDDVITQGL